MDGDKEISDMMAQKCVITDEIETGEIYMVVENQTTVEVNPCETSQTKKDDLQERKPEEMQDEEVLTTVQNYLDVIRNITFSRVTNCQYFELIQAESLQEIYNNIEEFVEDLFSADSSWALAHCVSEDLAMFKGIALEFRRRFKQVEFIRKQKAGIGHVAVLHHIPNENPANNTNNNSARFVFYLVTKQYFHHKPTYYHIYCALVRLRSICEELNVTKLAMPKIASGCDRMDFRRVKHLIHVAFLGSPVLIRIYTKMDSNAQYYGSMLA